MREHGLTQSDLPGVGPQSVVSEILSGKRQLNLRQIRWLAERFNVPVDVFILDASHDEQLISRCLPHSGGRSA